MSPRAACRLESLGFEGVYDYTAGIADWKAAGLVVEGTEQPGLRVADATRPDIPRTTPSDRVGDVLTAIEAADWAEALVVGCDGVVMGRLRGEAWEQEPSAVVGDVMESGPTTVRPDGSLHDLSKRMQKRGTELVVVTDPQGHLVGVVLAGDARRLSSGERPERVWRNCEGCPGRWRTLTAQ